MPCSRDLFNSEYRNLVFHLPVENMMTSALKGIGLLISLASFSFHACWKALSNHTSPTNILISSNATEGNRLWFIAVCYCYYHH